jgi:hypothetical protein
MFQIILNRAKPISYTKGYGTDMVSLERLRITKHWHRHFVHSSLLLTGRRAASCGEEGVASGRRLAARNTLHQSRRQQRDAVSSHTRAGSPRRFFFILPFVGLSKCFRFAAVGRFPQQIVSRCSSVKAATFNYEIIRIGETWCIIEAQILAMIRQRQRKLEQRGWGVDERVILSRKLRRLGWAGQEVVGEVLKDSRSVVQTL